ncbi:MAG: tripartite tricarboxylate transporter substrate binding protein [Pigmentiphaga sp.]|nr:tripartite tricarboxylate transporter substrate binding protein [Pigmentiphaga sp.]
MKQRRLILTGIAAAIAAPLILGGGTVHAQDFPSKPVRVITPFPPGAGPEVAMRVVSEPLARKWDQPVIVDNRSGGNGLIAVNLFKSAPEDYHNLLLIDSNHATTHPHTFQNLPYDVQQDFQPIGIILRTPFFVAVAPDSPYQSVEDIVSAAKADPEGITYGSWFVGSPGHIGAARLESLSDVRMQHIPYRDFGQLYAAVSTQEVDWALGSIASAGALERGGKLRFLALAAPERSPLYPDVPATSERPGLQDFQVNAWVGLFAHKSMPAEVRDQVAADLREALGQASVVERYQSLGYETPQPTPSEFGALIQRETDGWADIIRAANIRLD